MPSMRARTHGHAARLRDAVAPGRALFGDAARARLRAAARLRRAPRPARRRARTSRRGSRCVLTCAKPTLFCQSQHRALAEPAQARAVSRGGAASRGGAGTPAYRQGDWVSIETPEGSVRACARFNETLDPRVVVGQHGWWQACAELDAPGYDPFGPNGANYNLLIDATVARPGQPHRILPRQHVRDSGSRRLVTARGGGSTARSKTKRPTLPLSWRRMPARRVMRGRSVWMMWSSKSHLGGDMQILVLGAGALGGYFGGKLLEGGVNVEFLVRPRRAAQLRERGLIVKTQEGEIRRPARTVQASGISGTYDAVLLCVQGLRPRRRDGRDRAGRNRRLRRRSGVERRSSYRRLERTLRQEPCVRRADGGERCADAGARSCSRPCASR